MSWKPLPHEKPAKPAHKKTHIRSAFKKHALKKVIKSKKTSYRLLQSVSIRLLEFVKKEGKYSFQEVGDLITDMQRSIINLQRKRTVLIDKQTKKNKNRSSKKSKFKIKKIKN